MFLTNIHIYSIILTINEVKIKLNGIKSLIYIFIINIYYIEPIFIDISLYNFN